MLNRFEMVIAREGFHYTITGNHDAVGDSHIEAMFMAMKEGLEANGFDVHANITVETVLTLGDDDV